VVQGRIRECSKDVFIGQLFIETALVRVKENNDLLCHSQLDGSQSGVAMIC
jgi:alpha-D-ribose 1-methylphosphonate 5-triphosphate synthase subunit PhnG